MASVRILVDWLITRPSLVPQVRIMPVARFRGCLRTMFFVGYAACDRYWTRIPPRPAGSNRHRTHREKPQQQPGRQQAAKCAGAAEFVHGKVQP